MCEKKRHQADVCGFPQPISLPPFPTNRLCSVSSSSSSSAFPPCDVKLLRRAQDNGQQQAYTQAGMQACAAAGAAVMMAVRVPVRCAPCLGCTDEDKEGHDSCPPLFSLHLLFLLHQR
ncbi:hypothetical protein PTSG_11891 [Salpingoeca rosetta]|uniref:Uncharacterized protein n=1 Tax=Salpingoeca rosetta (strain ATCC 50818 / BSB-021) TaxID=946362 RepID=F2U2J5_SALR5|nr:uncharacterized protein PTSG_11891 [Salpingoeca rosetta]EGD81847.1 hypothetical protein PTSG_11891 [Salpingoeca rosetta]|eukprot:XP_004997051.1 hypothetical protein PTSG_11891 [Salpingoeca rosetta]